MKFMNSFTDWETELYHHGILGQKWGIRRFQNEDGSLTPAGLKRYGVNENGELSNKAQKKLFKDLKKFDRLDRRKSKAFYDLKIRRTHPQIPQKDIDHYLYSLTNKKKKTDAKIISVVSKFLDNELAKNADKPLIDVYKQSGETDFYKEVTNKLLGKYANVRLHGKYSGDAGRMAMDRYLLKDSKNKYY